MRMKEKNKKLNAITAAVVCAASVVIVIALVNIVGISSEYQKGETAYESLAEYADIPEDFGLVEFTAASIAEQDQASYENNMGGSSSGDGNAEASPSSGESADPAPSNGASSQSNPNAPEAGSVPGPTNSQTGAASIEREASADTPAEAGPLVIPGVSAAPAASSAPGASASAPGGTGAKGTQAAHKAFIDFDALKKINEDITAWLYIPGTDINYPILHGEDNDYYLNHSADKAENNSGSIFIDAVNSPGFADRNTVIYGHNMKNGAMFAGLHKFEDKEYYEDHPYLYIFTDDDKAVKYEIISAYETPASDQAAYSIEFEDEKAFLDYVGKAIESAPIKPEPEPTAENKAETKFDEDSKIITLSTCVTGEHDQRYILVAVEKQVL